VRVADLQRAQNRQRLGVQAQVEQPRRLDLAGHHELGHAFGLHRVEQRLQAAQMHPDHLVGVLGDDAFRLALEGERHDPLHALRMRRARQLPGIGAAAGDDPEDLGHGKAG